MPPRVSSPLRSSFIQHSHTGGQQQQQQPRHHPSSSPLTPILISMSPTSASSRNNHNTKKHRYGSSRMLLIVIVMLLVGTTLYYDTNVTKNYLQIQDSASSLSYSTAFSTTIYKSVSSAIGTTYYTTAAGKASPEEETEEDKDNREGALLSRLFQPAQHIAQTKPNPEFWTDHERAVMRNHLLDQNRNYLVHNIHQSSILYWDKDFRMMMYYFAMRSNVGSTAAAAHSKSNRLYDFYDLFPNEYEGELSEKVRTKLIKKAWSGRRRSNNDEKKKEKNPNGTGDVLVRIIHIQNLCEAYQYAKDYNQFQTRHVLITHMNENWGALSTEVPGRTGTWGEIQRRLDDDHRCPWHLIRDDYLNSPNTLAVFTTQHQALFDHPKVYSVPIGVSSGASRTQNILETFQTEKLQQQKEHQQRQQQQYSNATILDESGNATMTTTMLDLVSERDRLLMINAFPSPERKPQIEAVIHNFISLGYGFGGTEPLHNLYVRESNDGGSDYDAYVAQLKRSKFILCPSGLGWDTYRMYEALHMGTIPVMERMTYRYQVITYPPATQRLPQLVPLFRDQYGRNKTRQMLNEETQAVRDIEKYNATVEIIEYDDGWQHRTLEDLPIVWIDGKFTNTVPEDTTTTKEANYSTNRNYVTPELLEQEYDRLAILAAHNKFRYQKLTSTYWINKIESFAIQDTQNNNKNAQQLLELHQNTSWSSLSRHQDLKLKFAEEEDEDEFDSNDDDDDDNDDTNDEDNKKKHHESSVSSRNTKTRAEGSASSSIKMMGWSVLVWEIIVLLKIVGVVLIIIAVRHFDYYHHHQRHQTLQQRP